MLAVLDLLTTAASLVVHRGRGACSCSVSVAWTYGLLGVALLCRCVSQRVCEKSECECQWCEYNTLILEIRKKTSDGG